MVSLSESISAKICLKGFEYLSKCAFFKILSAEKREKTEKQEGYFSLSYFTNNNQGLAILGPVSEAFSTNLLWFSWLSGSKSLPRDTV